LEVFPQQWADAQNLTKDRAKEELMVLEDATQKNSIPESRLKVEFIPQELNRSAK